MRSSHKFPGGSIALASKKRRVGILFGAAAAGLAAGVAIERNVVGRMRSRPDPESSEELGKLRGEPLAPLASFDGTKLHVEKIGEGPTVILAHGYSLDLRTWHYQMRDLSSRYRLVLFDQRGHGRSEPARSDDWSIDALARDLLAVVERSEAERVAIVGHSMGGMALIRFCELFPEIVRDRVSGISLVDTTAADVVREALPFLPRRLRAAAQGAQEVAMRAIVSLDRPSVDRLRRRASDVAWLGVRTMGFGPNASPSHVAFLERMLSETPVDTWMELMPAVIGVNTASSLEHITVPTLVMVGTEDRLTPPGAAERLSEEIKDARLVRILGAGHCPMIESYQVFNARLGAFLDGLVWQA